MPTKPEIDRGDQREPPTAELLPKRNKRIVLEHTTGPLTGLCRITGLEADAPDPLPTFVAEVDMLSHFGPAGLVAVKRSYVLYREVITPESYGSMDEDQL